MDFDSIAFASQGEASLLVFRCPEELSQNGSEVECYALAILPRTNGMLLCLPRNVISEEAMIAALGAGEEGLLGPTKLIQAPLCEESEDGTTITTSGPHRYMYLVDFNLEVLQYLQEYDPIIVGDAITPFDQEVPNAIPVSSTVLEIASVWVSEQGFARANFYSAREEQEVPSEPGPKAPAKATSKKAGTPKRISNAQVMEQLAQMASQIQALAMRQETAEQGKAEGTGPTLQAERAFGSIQPVPAVSAGLGTGGVPPLGAVAKALQLVGPPPRTRQGRAVHQDPEPVEQEVQDPFKAPALGIVPKSGIEAALAQQSTAITTLVAHLASQADPLGDLSSTAVSSSSTKGVQRRERLQNELASRNSTFYLQVMQQVHRRLHPGRPAPKVEADLAGLSFLSYLEKNGGFPSSSRCRTSDVAHGTCDGGSSYRRCMVDEGEAGPCSGRSGSERFGPRRLDAGLFAQPCRGPSDRVVPREDKHYISLWEAILGSGPADLGSDLPSLREGARDPHHEESRGLPQEEQGCKARRSKRTSFPQEKAEVPKETQSRCPSSLRRLGPSMHDEDYGKQYGPAKPGSLLPTVPPGPKGACHYDGTTSGRPRRPSPGEVSMHVWCGHLLRATLKTRTLFAEFTRRCNHLQRSNTVSSSPAMPLPIPFLLDFEATPSTLSCRHRSKLYFRRAINLVVLALNFWWADCKLVDPDLLRRTPSWQQRLIYDRIARLLRWMAPDS